MEQNIFLHLFRFPIFYSQRPALFPPNRWLKFALILDTLEHSYTSNKKSLDANYATYRMPRSHLASLLLLRLIRQTEPSRFEPR